MEVIMVKAKEYQISCEFTAQPGKKVDVFTTHAANQRDAEKYGRKVLTASSYNVATVEARHV
jgi:hypothetical protein